MAAVIAHALEVAETAAFWEDVRSTMGSGAAHAAVAWDVETVAGSLADGLDPDEDWNDIL